MKINYKQLVKVATEQGWDVFPDKDVIDLRIYSPAGEDFGFSIDKNKDYIEQIEDFESNFDPDEHAEQWCRLSAEEKSRMGVPPISVLLEDAKDIKQMLVDLVNAVNGLV